MSVHPVGQETVVEKCPICLKPLQANEQCQYFEGSDECLHFTQNGEETSIVPRKRGDFA